MKSLLSVHGLTKLYGVNRALSNASFDLHQGEVLCVVGENGAGKSTLIKALSGAITPNEGTIEIQGDTLSMLNPHQAIKLGIATIYQETELIDSLSVAANIVLGREPKSKRRLFVDTQKEYTIARALLERLHVDIDEKALVESLSTAQKQTVQIVKALQHDTKILIMDEPTSSLGFEETVSLMDLVKELRSQGMGIIYISHHLEEVFEIGDTIMVLKDGEHVGSFSRDEVTAELLVKKMVGRDASSFFTRPKVEMGPVWFAAKNLSWSGKIEDVSFSVRRGEVFGIGGLVGSGRTELINLIYGLSHPDSGEIFLEERSVKIRNPKQALKNGICLISEDRHEFGMLNERNVQENITVGFNELRNKVIPGNVFNEKQSVNMMQKLRIRATGPRQIINRLSGGNQQKVMIARWLLDNFQLYIFDEPTKGVDVGAKAEIYELIINAAKRGKCIIVISSEMPELLSLSDRIGVMRNGKMTHVLENENIKEEELIQYFMGVQEHEQ